MKSKYLVMLIPVLILTSCNIDNKSTTPQSNISTDESSIESSATTITTLESIVTPTSNSTETSISESSSDNTLPTTSEESTTPTTSETSISTTTSKKEPTIKLSGDIDNGSDTWGSIR